jgi:hypothetical protein
MSEEVQEQVKDPREQARDRLEAACKAVLAVCVAPGILGSVSQPGSVVIAPHVRGAPKTWAAGPPSARSCSDMRASEFLYPPSVW